MPGMPFLEAYEDDRALQLAIELQHLMTMGDSNTTISDDLGAYYPTCEDVRNKKSQNMTECVPVPSSEHVAEIVGRQGKKLLNQIPIPEPLNSPSENVNLRSRNYDAIIIRSC